MKYATLLLVLLMAMSTDGTFKPKRRLGKLARPLPAITCKVRAHA